MSGDEWARAVCAMGMIVVGGFVIALRGHAASGGSSLSDGPVEMNEAQVMAIERRHFDVYSAYSLMQEAASGSPAVSGRRECLASSATFPMTETMVAKTFDVSSPPSTCNAAD